MSHDHEHGHNAPLPEVVLRVKALEALLTEKGLVDTAALDAIAAIPSRDRLESHYLLHAVLGELHWRLKGNVFRQSESGMQTITLPYQEIEAVELHKKWWKLRSIIGRSASSSCSRMRSSCLD